MEITEETYTLTRQLYRDAMRVVNGAKLSTDKGNVLINKEHLERLRDTLEALKNTKRV